MYVLLKIQAKQGFRWKLGDAADADDDNDDDDDDGANSWNLQVA